LGTAPGSEQRLLDEVLGVLEGAEHPVAVDLEFPPVALGHLPEGGLVVRQSLDLDAQFGSHDRSDRARAENSSAGNRLVFARRWVYPFDATIPNRGERHSETIASPQLFERGGSRPSELERLEVFIGKWINTGQTVGEVPVPIVTSDVYEWVPGGFFVLHTAYGQIGDLEVGGIEILGRSPNASRYFSVFYDSGRAVHRADLSVDGSSWTWRGSATGCTAVISADGRVQTAHHVRLDGDRWVPSMGVLLRKVA
jgi:hypothetical protein